MDNNLPSEHNLYSSLLTIWVKPRDTIRQIVNIDPRFLVILMTAIAGFGQAIDRASSRDAGDVLNLLEIMIICSIGGPLSGIFSLYISGALFRWTGSWFGGQASTEEIRAAIAWSTVPAIIAYITWIPLIGVAGLEMFTSYTPRINANPILALFILAIVGVQIILAIWAIVLYINCMSEVQIFSAWKAIASIILGGLIIVIPITLIVFMFQAITISP